MASCRNCGAVCDDKLCSACTFEVLVETKINQLEKEKSTTSLSVDWKRIILLIALWSIPGIFISATRLTLPDKELLLIRVLLMCAMAFFMGLLALLVGVRDGDLPRHCYNDPRTPLDIRFPFSIRTPTYQPIGFSVVGNALIAFFMTLLFLFAIRVYQDKFFMPTGQEIHELLKASFSAKIRTSYPTRSVSH